MQYLMLYSELDVVKYRLEIDKNINKSTIIFLIPFLKLDVAKIECYIDISKVKLPLGSFQYTNR